MSYQRLTLLLLGCLSLANWPSATHAQPLIRPGDDLLREEQADRSPEAEGAEDERLPDEDLSPDAERRRTSQSRRRAAAAEETQRLSVQEQILQMQREQMEADRAAKERETRLMRIAGITAIVVIAMTVLIAYARTKKEDAESGRAGGAPSQTSGGNETADPNRLA